MRHKILTGAMAVVLLGAFGSAMGGGKEPASSSMTTPSSAAVAAKAAANPAKTSAAPAVTQTQEAPAAEAPTAGIGTPANDGKFEFTVKSVKCGIASVGPDFMAEKAQGEFCRVTLRVRNKDKAPQMMFADSQKAFAGESEYSANSMASVTDASANNTQSVWMENINPGNAVQGNLFFDVPKGTKLTKLVLHDSAFSGGVDIKL
ncbi:DUF4352 domain-containing protein [Arsenicicoccus cauae]|uniref:DUF4352 domain-containing protein n=1 Tax=Arsenicicoccus cauae TaxID=2663847 RepID=UPI0018A74231|nr:DUF4352 domain-containing protein [Arsenicicoccus cauae]